jgi:hypothetical protein
MYVCESCHGKICQGQHVLVTFAPCELCKLDAECFDCVSRNPVTKAELEAVRQRRNWITNIYLHCGQLEYPRPKEGDGS